MKYFVGVSGFSYPAWKGTFCEEGTKPEDFLAFYSKRLGSVEINSSFYAPPRAAMVKGWSEKTSDGFRFAFKAPKQVTHILKLGEGSSEAAERFSNTLDLLGQKKGPILFQLPPYSKQNLDTLEAFLGRTGKIQARVFEFRHASWLQKDTYALLEKNNAAFCIVESEDLKPEFQVTAPLAYFRLRLDAYDKRTIGSWAPKIRDAAQGAAECFVYLRHDESGNNAVLAQELSSLLE